jgi:hypothetical protein
MAGTKRAKPRTAKRTARPATKQKSTARTAKKTTAKPRAARASVEKAIVAAAPLLATTPKKVGKVAGKASEAVKPNAPYQPKTGGASSTVAKPPARMPASLPFDPLALARPWMRLGAEMAMSNLSLQTRIAKAAMDLPPTATAIRQGSAVYSAWLAMLGGPRPVKS